MKASDLLADVGRPIAYYPALRQITGSATATLLLCQLLYWTDKEKAGDGWIFKRAEKADGEQSIEEETGLSYEEQSTARRILRRKGILEEKNRRLEHKLYFRVNKARLSELWAQQHPELGDAQMPKPGIAGSGEPKSPVPEQADHRVANKPFSTSLIGTTQNTPENTSQTTPQNTSQSTETQNQKQKQISDLQKSFSELAGLKDIPQKGDPRYVEWQKSYQQLAEICVKYDISAGVLALCCAMRRDELGLPAKSPGSYLNIAKYIGKAWADPAQRPELTEKAMAYGKNLELNRQTQE